MFIRNHWKLFTALMLALLMAIIVLFLITLYPPTLPFLISLSPFAILATMSVAVAALVGAGIAAAFVLLICLGFNMAVAITNFLDDVIPEEKPGYDYEPKNQSSLSKFFDLFKSNKDEDYEPPRKKPSAPRYRDGAYRGGGAPAHSGGRSFFNHNQNVRPNRYGNNPFAEDESNNGFGQQTSSCWR